MTVRLVAVPSEEWQATFGHLARDAEAAARAQGIALPGDTTAACQYGELAALIETTAATLRGCEELLVPGLPDGFCHRGDVRHSWLAPGSAPLSASDETGTWLNNHIAAGFAIVELYEVGSRICSLETDQAATLPPVAERPRVQPGASPIRTKVIAERFQCRVALGREGHPVDVSDMPNPVLTEGLHDLVARPSNAHDESLTTPIIYGDGSEGPQFPVNAVRFADLVNDSWPTLSVAMLSMRHPEMDHLVCGAFLRNSEISRDAAHGHVDMLAYQRATEAIDALSQHGPVHIRVHQTGFQPPLVGLYRAVTDALLREREVAVTPVFFGSHGRTREGMPWVKAY